MRPASLEGWSVVRVAPQQETSVARACGLLLPPVETWLPRVPDASGQPTKRLVMSGYVFCKDVTEPQHAQLRAIPGVRLGQHEVPQAIAADQIAEMLGPDIETAPEPEPIVRWRAGDVVRVTSGPFEGQTGVVERAEQAGSGSISVRVNMFGRLSLVTCERGALEMAAPAPVAQGAPAKTLTPASKIRRR